jgi:hypothetical protein
MEVLEENENNGNLQNLLREEYDKLTHHKNAQGTKNKPKHSRHCLRVFSSK